MSNITPAMQRLCSQAGQINLENLRRILADNQQTEFGRQHGFADIHDADTYRKQVPLADYSDFEAGIARMRQGEQQVLTAYPVFSYCRTSGSMGHFKYIPLTRTALEQYADYVYPKTAGKRLFVNAFHTDLRKPMEQTALFSEIHHRWLYERGYLDAQSYPGGTLLLFPQEEGDLLYAKLRVALACPDLRLIESIFLYELLPFFSRLEADWQTILTDMQQQTVPETIQLSPEIRTYLETLPVSRERLDEIRTVCSKGFDGIARRLWKYLDFVSGITSRFHISEQAALRFYLGDTPQNYFGYGASECCIAVSRAFNDYGNVLLPPCAFFEFLPYHAGNSRTVLPQECRVGELYETVLTNFSGLYRYRMGDIMKVTDFVGESPVLEFQFRRGLTLNIAGEKCTEIQLEQAVYALRETGMTVSDFCTAACLDNIPGSYLFLLGTDSGSLTPETAAAFLDRNLCTSNLDYAELRQLGRLQQPTVLLCSSDAFSGFMQAVGLMQKHGHNKPHHLILQEVRKAEWIQILQTIRYGSA